MPVRGMTARDAPFTEAQIEIATVDESPAPAVSEGPVAAVGARSSRGERSVARGGSVAAPAASGEAASSGSGPALSFVVPIGPRDIGLSPGGSTPFVGTAAKGAFAEEERRNPLRDALVEADRIKGLGPEGPVLGALRNGTSRSLAPVTGRAVFTVKANAEGEVTEIDVDDRSGGPGWDDAARVALEELRGKKLRMPSKARGLYMRFEVVSSIDGHRLDFGGRMDEETQSPALVLPDESNIGRKPSRQIRTRSLSTEVL